MAGNNFTQIQTPNLAQNVISLVSSGPGAKTRKRSPRVKKYHFPKIFLRQSYFCRSHGGQGEWFDPTFSFQMLGHKEFVSQIGALLDSLEVDGHHVKGPRIELLAYRDLLQHYHQLFSNLYNQPHRSALADHLYQSSDK